MNDITYCSNFNCTEICIRNQRLIPNSDRHRWVADFINCEYFEKVKKVEEENE